MVYNTYSSMAMQQEAIEKGGTNPIYLWLIPGDQNIPSYNVGHPWNREREKVGVHISPISLWFIMVYYGLLYL